MDTITFYDEWLHLPKQHFRILAMLADVGEFRGNLADICRYLRINPDQKKNREKLRESIEYLTSIGFIICQQSGRTYQLQAIPKEKAIPMKREWLHHLMNRTNKDPSVAWEQVLKVYLWIREHYSARFVTNQQIATDLGISVKTVVDAKNVLKREYGAIIGRTVSEKFGEDQFCTLGQQLIPNAWWNV